MMLRRAAPGDVPAMAAVAVAAYQHAFVGILEPEVLAQAEAAGTCSLECFRDNLRARAFYEAKGWRLTRSYEREFAGKVRAFVFYEKAPTWATGRDPDRPAGLGKVTRTI